MTTKYCPLLSVPPITQVVLSFEKPMVKEHFLLITVRSTAVTTFLDLNINNQQLTFDNATLLCESKGQILPILTDKMFLPNSTSPIWLNMRFKRTNYWMTNVYNGKHINVVTKMNFFVVARRNEYIGHNYLLF